MVVDIKKLNKKKLEILLEKQLKSPSRFIISPININLFGKHKIDKKAYAKRLKEVKANYTVLKGIRI